MSIIQTKIESTGVEKRFKNYTIAQAISEYIWNAIDSDANNINILYTTDDDFQEITTLSINDDGKGINPSSFTPILDSHKKQGNIKKIQHGSHGMGRLSFIKFAETAIWQSKQVNTNEKQQYQICRTGLNEYEFTSTIDNTKNNGTTVTFKQFSNTFIESTIIDDITPFLEREFAVYLAFKPELNIFINQEPLNKTKYILDDFHTKKEISNNIFDIKIIKWNEKLKPHKSRFFYSSNDYNNSLSLSTLFNRKSLTRHSIIIKSDFFKVYIPKTAIINENPKIQELFSNDEDLDKVFKLLNAFLKSELQKKLYPDIEQRAKDEVIRLDNNKIFPTAENKYDKLCVEDLKNFIYELYILEPTIFNNLNQKQQKIMITLFDRILKDNHIEECLEVISQVLDLDDTQLEKLNSQLKTIKLNNIINTIDLLQNRKRIVEGLEKLVIEECSDTVYEQHIQEVMEQNYWLIDEKYHLIGAEEDKWDKIFKDIIKYTTNEDVEKLNNIGGKREPDIVMVRPNYLHNKTECVVLEFKKPSVIISKKEYEQIQEYADIVRESPQVNGDEFQWSFYLITNKIASGYKKITDNKENLKTHNEPGLVNYVENGKYKIYIKQWCDIFESFNRKYNHLYNILAEKREQISQDLTAEEQVSELIEPITKAA